MNTFSNSRFFVKILDESAGADCIDSQGRRPRCDVLLFSSHDYRFNFQLSKEKFEKINNSRKRLILLGYAGSRVKQRKCTFHLSGKTEYGNPKHRYWSYEDIVLKLEDYVDGFRSINGEKYDYCFLFDHSNGCDRFKPYDFNLNKISKYFEGKQMSMRDSTIYIMNHILVHSSMKIIKNWGYSVNIMGKSSWRSFYMSQEQRDQKIYDKK